MALKIEKNEGFDMAIESFLRLDAVDRQIEYTPLKPRIRTDVESLF